jgi:hypothetical protein
MTKISKAPQKEMNDRNRKLESDKTLRDPCIRRDDRKREQK